MAAKTLLLLLLLLYQYVKGLGLPKGVVSTVLRNYKACDSRLWLIDNSSSMSAMDSHIIGGKLHEIKKNETVSHWQELQECVAFHAKMAARVWLPTKFWLVNDPGPEVGLQKFSLCWESSTDIATEMSQLKHIMTTATPRMQKNQLAHQIRSVQRGVTKEASRLLSQHKHITFVLCTQGIPTDAQGQGGPTVTKEFQQALSTLSRLPVKVVLRLCTNDAKMLKMVDNRLAVSDVLVDFW